MIRLLRYLEDFTFYRSLTDNGVKSFLCGRLSTISGNLADYLVLRQSLRSEFKRSGKPLILPEMSKLR